MVNGARRLAPLAVVLLASCAAPLALAAQTAESAGEAPPWLQLIVVDVDPTMVEEFLAVQREFTARAKEAEVPWRSVSRTEVFGDTYRFLVVTPLENLATFDEREDPDPQLSSLIDRAERTITRRRSYAVRTLPDVSKPLPGDKQPGLMVVNVARVFPSREQDYVDVMTSDFLPHFDEAGIHYVTGALAFGGEGGFLHVFFIEDFAELDKGSPVVRELGAEGAQEATKKLSGIVSSSELWIVRLLPEVSYGPEPSEPSSR